MAVVCAGIDWASEEHAVCVLTGDGEVLHEGTVRHDEAGLAKLCRLLRGLEADRVAIERPDGVLVDRLVAAGLVVYRPAPQPGEGGARALPRLRGQVGPLRRARAR